MRSRSEVTALLRSANLNVAESNEEEGWWKVGFDIQGKPKLAHVVHAEGLDSLVLFSFPQSPKLEDKTLDELPAETLRTIIREGSIVLLAKLVIAPPSLYVVVSECYRDSLTSDELRDRLEACARLAAKLDLALS